MKCVRALALAAGLALISASCIARVSLTAGGGQANGASNDSSLSSNGRYLAFVSSASDLVGDDANGQVDVFVRDLWTGATTRVSSSSSGVESDAPAWDPFISGDGMRIVFWSHATNLIDGELSSTTNAYLHDLSNGTTIRVASTPTGEIPDGPSYSPAISADGTTVVFESEATNLVPGDTNQRRDIFRFDVASADLERVSVSNDGSQADSGSTHGSVSGNGETIAFTSYATNLVPGDTNNQNDVFVRDRVASTTERVSVSSSGVQLTDVLGANAPVISASGQFVVFFSGDADLVPVDTNNTDDVFRHDRSTGDTTLVSTATDGSQGSHYSAQSSISDDGNLIAFQSFSTFDLAITTAIPDVFVKNMATGDLLWATRPVSGPGPNGFNYPPAISGNGLWVALASDATNLDTQDDTNNATDVFVWRHTD